MREIDVREDSWHYRLATVYIPADPEIYTDVCGYRCGVLMGFAVCCIIVTLGVFLLYPIVDVLVSSVWGDGFFSSTYWLVVVLYLMAASVISSYKGLCLWNDRRPPKTRKIKIRPVKPVPKWQKSVLDTTFIVREMYRSWREKYCVPIRFVK